MGPFRLAFLSAGKPLTTNEALANNSGQALRKWGTPDSREYPRGQLNGDGLSLARREVEAYQC